MAGLRGPETGCNICPPNPRSFGPHILISCFLPLQPGVPFGRNEVVAVFERRKSCKTPVMRPVRFRTTVAIIEVTNVGSLTAKVANHGITNVWNMLDYLPSKECEDLPSSRVLTPGNTPCVRRQFADFGLLSCVSTADKRSSQH